MTFQMWHLAVAVGVTAFVSVCTTAMVMSKAGHSVGYTEGLSDTRQAIDLVMQAANTSRRAGKHVNWRTLCAAVGGVTDVLQSRYNGHHHHIGDTVRLLVEANTGTENV